MADPLPRSRDAGFWTLRSWRWLHFDSRQPKRKRAELVCSACHAKKVKCDLKSRRDQGHGICSNCHTAGRECQVRPSKRRKHPHPDASVVSVGGHPASPSSADDTRAEVGSVGGAPLPSTPAVPPPPYTNHHTLSPQSQRTTELLTGAPTGRSNNSDVDTGFLQVYGPENTFDAEQQELEVAMEQGYARSDAQQQELQQIFAETYFEYCYAWCPVLDPDRLPQDALRSPLLANALALAGSHIRPPLLPHEGPAAYYKRATSLFYNDAEADGVTTLQAISLFYWWAPRAVTIARRHSSWWWTSVLIRHAQQMNFHREPGPNYPLRDALDLGLRRRIWWTAFARERLTALCQSKPCVIDPTDCNIQEPTLADFPPDPRLQRKGEVFIYWVRLCAIMGRAAKSLSRLGSGTSASQSLPVELRQELVDWVQSLPPHLQLPIGSARTDAFDRDVHQLFLPYLTTIIILYLRRSSHHLPQALPPAVLAASCIVRILKDILSRGDARFLMAITCWYSGTAFIALLEACRVDTLAKDANEGLDVLTRAVEQLQKMWGSANVIRQGFTRLRQSSSFATSVPAKAGVLEADLSAHGPDVRAAQTDPQSDSSVEFDWTLLFPFVTPATGGIAEALLPGTEPGRATRFPTPENFMFDEAMLNDYHGLLEPFQFGEYNTMGFDDIGPIG
ncbi:hypothetical protein GQ53DRAFT_885014 [Thozetella sp. PMI_491]|nr:hypothetical protein GQ53DRAFT_885014 [Thozetella sp. PMI_491]